MNGNKQILERLMAELELALESDRGAATQFKAQVWRALERARRGSGREGDRSSRADRLLN
jgi:hypothetical protein